MSQSIADDITMTRQLWCEHVKSDSFDIDFVHGDIQGLHVRNENIVWDLLPVLSGWGLNS